MLGEHTDKKKHLLTADVEKILVVWMENQTNYTLFNSTKAKRGNEVTEAKSETRIGGFTTF